MKREIDKSETIEVGDIEKMSQGHQRNDQNVHEGHDSAEGEAVKLVSIQRNVHAHDSLVHPYRRQQMICSAIGYNAVDGYAHDHDKKEVKFPQEMLPCAYYQVTTENPQKINKP